MASGLRPAVGFAPESDLGAPRDVPPSNVPLDDPGGVRRHVHQLESQKEFLRTYAARLEAELRAYQTRFPDLTVAVDNDSDDLPPWIANAEYLSPLLLAYDAQIAQADALAADLKRELLAVKDDAKKMAKRNEELENELEHHIGKLLRRFDADSNWSGADGEEVGELNQRCALLGDENQMLRAQEAETRRELDDARVDVRDRDDLIMGLRNEVADLQATCAKVPDLSAQVDALEQELTMTRSQTETALGHMKSAQEQLLTTQVELQARARDADQFRQLLSEHDADSERCIAELRVELVRLNQMYTSAAGRVSDLERQLQDSTERERVFSRDVQVKQADLHGMLATIESLEKTMQDLQKTNATIGAELTSAKSDLEDARLARDEAVHRADGLAKQKQSLEDRMDLEITSYRDDANAAVAKALGTSRAKLDAMHAELRDLELARTSAENAKAKAERDAKSARAAYDELRATAAAQQERDADALNDARTQIVRLETQLDMSRDAARSAVTHLQERAVESAKERHEYDSKLAEIVKATQDVRDEAESLRDRNGRLERDLREARVEFECEARRRDAMESDLQEQCRVVQRSSEREIATLQDRVREVVAIQEKADARAIQLERDYDERIEMMQDSHRNSIVQMQRAVRDARDDATRASTRVQQLEAKLASVCAQRDDLRASLERSEQLVEEVRAAMAAADQRFAEESIRYSTAIDEQASLKRKCKDLQYALDKAELDLKREQRMAEKNARRIELQCLGIDLKKVPGRYDQAAKNEPVGVDPGKTRNAARNTDG